MLHDKYEPVIGLEVHCQLLTDSKVFSPDSAAFGGAPNTHVDPISLGHPGTLPVLNKRVVEYTLRMGLATHCKITPRSVFARKHYFYPDLPKGYQISQYDTPICYDGYVDITLEDEEGASGDGAPAPRTKRIGLTRIHIEEDAGKSMHDRDVHDTLVDFNRCGVALIEIVSEPDLRSPREAYEYLKKIRQIVRYLGISDGNMEEGSLRCDANISVRPKGRREFGTRTELKNMNSMRNVERAIEYEITRQIALVEQGGEVVQQTMLWDTDANETRTMRSKEAAHDYRYFPDPDLVEVVVSEDMIEEVKASLPEMPDDRRQRLIDDMGLPAYDAHILTEERGIADYFEETLSALFKRTKGGNTNAQAKAVSNFIMTEVLRVLNERSIGIEAFPISADRLASLIYLRMQEKVSSSGAQEVFEIMLHETDKSAGKIADERNLIQVSDKGALEPVIDQVLEDNPKKVETYLGGKQGLIGFFIGQVMRGFDGSPDPKMVRELLNEKLEARRSEKAS